MMLYFANEKYYNNNFAIYDNPYSGFMILNKTTIKGYEGYN